MRDYPRRWLEHHAPEPAELLELLTQVRWFLGKDGYYWFCACAVYPELHWELTLYLGDKLTSDDDEKLLTETNLAKLARLPWFRYGYMPDWLRERLVADLLAVRKDKEIRTAIEAFLQPTPEESSDTQLEVAVGQPSTEGNPVSEHLFVRFMAGGKELPFKLPKIFYEYVREFVLSKFLPVFGKMTSKLSTILSKLSKSPEWLGFGLIILGAIVVLVLSKWFGQPVSSLWFWLFLGSAVVVVLFGRKLFRWFRQQIALLTTVPRFYRKLTLSLVVGLGIYSLLIVFYDSSWVMDIEDTGADWLMQLNEGIIPPLQAKNIPPFVLLDVDDKTYSAWGEPLFTPRNRLTNLIKAAVEAKARLVIVDIDVSQPAPVVNSQLHPYDQALKDYLANYATECKQKTDKSACPFIIMVRAFSARSDPVPVLRTGFLEEVVAQSAPYMQWASAHFYRAEDQVIRRWQVWQPACTTDKQPQIVPSIELLAMAMVQGCSTEDIQKALRPFLSQNCDNNYVPPPVQTVKLCQLKLSTDKRGIHQRIMYGMPWGNDGGPSLPYLVTDATGVPITTIFSAQHYAEATPKASLAPLTDSIVVIGGSHSDGGNIHLTPLGEMSGSLIIINAIHSLLQYGTLEPLSIWWRILFLSGFIFIMSLVLARFTSFWGMVLSGTFIIFVVLPMISILLFPYDIWFYFALLSLIVVLVYRIASDFDELRQRNKPVVLR